MEMAASFANFHCPQALFHTQVSVGWSVLALITEGSSLRMSVLMPSTESTGVAGISH